jgi:predicted short-subunit dehydrogenase-like oxidoreductase (DUF2520 family)
MNIVIIGTGNTATLLGRKLKAAGHEILQVFGRNSMEASELAYELDTESTNYWNIVNRNADLYILAVSDIAIRELIQELRLPESTIVVHTAAAVEKDIFKGTTEHYGVFYPLQSLRKEQIYLPDIPIIVDASDGNTQAVLEMLAYSITDKVVRANDEERLKMHLVAVFCNNFVNHLYVIADDYCKKEGIDFSIMLPLIRETVSRLDALTPRQSQTGPAIRNDTETIKRHLALLDTYPDVKKIYEAITESIYRYT